MGRFGFVSMGSKTAKDFFCPTCGILPFRRPSDPTYNEILTINQVGSDALLQTNVDGSSATLPIPQEMFNDSTDYALISLGGNGNPNQINAFINLYPQGNFVIEYNLTGTINDAFASGSPLNATLVPTAVSAPAALWLKLVKIV